MFIFSWKEWNKLNETKTKQILLHTKNAMVKGTHKQHVCLGKGKGIAQAHVCLVFYIRIFTVVSKVRQDGERMC